jgi:hypothetical protein
MITTVRREDQLARLLGRNGKTSPKPFSGSVTSRALLEVDLPNCYILAAVTAEAYENQIHHSSPLVAPR